VCRLLKARGGFVDDASLRDHGPRCVEEVKSRSGLERIRAGDTNVLGQLLAARSEAGGEVEDEELEAGCELVVPQILLRPVASAND
jgi:hypothetical protein